MPLDTAVTDELWNAFRYETTEHPCPACKTLLQQVLPSTMLTCNEGHGPYFLV